MRLQLDYSSSMPIYEQIKVQIKDNIYGGTLKDKEVLPSIRQLAKELNVSMITVKRAYTDLESEGLVNTVSGKGTFVNIEDYSRIIESRRKELLQELRENIIKLKLAGVDEEQVIEAVIREYSLVRGE